MSPNPTGPKESKGLIENHIKTKRDVFETIRFNLWDKVYKMNKLSASLYAL